jgi:O-acetylhomoserine/O-acetylserine sulfhydrylase-like pyridoxal-dependent enzyme
VQLLRDLGQAITPFNSFLFLQGLETLSLRMERHNDNAAKVAAYLAGHSQVEEVQHASLTSSPWHERAKKYTAGKGFGSVPAFIIKGGKEACFRFMDALKLIDIANNLGDAKSMATHPATTTHMRVGAEERAKLGITDGTVRLSVGLEDVADLIDDLSEALDAAAS